MPGLLAGLAAGYAFNVGAQIADYALGKPFALWSGTIDANLRPQIRSTNYDENIKRPNVAPSPDSIIHAWQAGLVSDDDMAYGLGYQGILVANDNSQNQLVNLRIGQGLSGPNYDYWSNLWRAVSDSQISRPAPGEIASLAAQSRLLADDYARLTRNVVADHSLFRRIAAARYQTPGISDLWQLWHLGKISPTQYYQWVTRAGWTNREALNLSQQVSVLPTLPEMMLARYRGLLSDVGFANMAKAAGWTDDTALNAAVLAMRPAPGPADLVRFALREAWDEDAAREWGYDEERPAAFDAWMRWQGMGWGEQLPDGQGGRIPRVTWPMAFWRAHWQIISPQQAYRAIHLLRPDRIGRYQQIAPGVTPFTHDDLRRVLKVSDYPPKMRAWLAAISYLPLRLTDIRGAFVNHVRDRQWAIDQLLDRGYVREDAVTVVELWGRAPADKLRQALEAYGRRTVMETIAETRLAYRMGGLADTDASARLVQIGLNLPTVQRILALEDARAAREQLVQFIRQLRRSYLTGALSDAEALASLSAARIAPAAQARYLRLWQSELTAGRRSLSTQQVTQAVATGELAPAVGALRLGRLGWTQPDASLLIQRAVAQLTRVQARAAAQAVSSAAQQQKALLAAQRQAQAAARSAQSQLRRIYPLGTLRRQYCLGIRRGPTVSALLLSQGYTPDAISALLLQWAHECEASPPAPDKRVGSLESYYRRQTPIGTLKQWWQNGVVTDKWTRARLAKLGFEPGAVTATIRLWQSTLGKKSGPAPEGTPDPAPLS